MRLVISTIAAVVLTWGGPVPAGAASDAEIVRPTEDFTTPEKYEERPGGATTHFKALNQDAFSHPSANISFSRQMDFRVGNGFFRRLWVSAPASTKAADGLGPLYNARSCQRCHLKDGRGHPPNGPDDSAVSMFLRLSVPPTTPEDIAAIAEGRKNVIPEPTYGGQLQDLSLPGHAAEGTMEISYTEDDVELADGTVVALRKPTYSIGDLGYGPLHPATMISPRVASPMIGLGLLEAIPEAAILANADPLDDDGDGISGRPQWAWNLETDQRALGRFGWKAGNPTVMQQSAGAFAGDIGISNPLVPGGHGECTPKQKACRAAVHGDDEQYEGVEAPQEVMDLVAFYSRNLAVPARRDIDDPEVLRGKEIFYDIGCVDCHVPKFITERDPVAGGATLTEQARQLIWPYSDLLLHDMGEGLADDRPEGRATGREWRTAPLWGIGLTETVNGHTFFLHDGRARSLLEAILWHGGEAQGPRDAVVALPTRDREALLRFLKSL